MSPLKNISYAFNEKWSCQICDKNTLHDFLTCTKPNILKIENMYADLDNFRCMLTKHKTKCKKSMSKNFNFHIKRVNMNWHILIEYRFCRLSKMSIIQFH